MFGLFRTRLTCIRLFKQVNCTVGSVGNSLIGSSSDLLVFVCERTKSDSLVKRAICLWKRTNRSSRSFLMSDLNESLMVVLLQTARRANRFCRSLKRAIRLKNWWANCQPWVRVLKNFSTLKTTTYVTGQDGLYSYTRIIIN